MTLTTEVVLCTYNGTAFIVEQLESLIRQTVPLNKISIYDDRSSDDTVAYIQEFINRLPVNQQELFSVEINERNLGYARNFSNGIGRASHDILFLCDQDDIWEPQKVEQFLNLFEAHNPDMVFSDGRLINEFGVELGKVTVLQSYGLSKYHRSHFREDAFQLLMKQNYINGAAAAIRRTTAQAAIPSPGDMAHDYWLAIWCSLHAGIVATPEPLYRYRQHRHNIFGVGGTNNLAYRWLGIWRQPDAPRKRELVIWKAITDRICALSCSQEIEVAFQKRHWLCQVVPRKKKRLTRGFHILKSALNGRYRAYSSIDSFLRDVVSLIKMIPIKIGFVLLSNSQHPIASTRIAALSMFPHLRAAGFEPSIVYEPTEGTETPDVSSLAPRLKAEGFKIIFFQKVYGPSVEALARKLSAAGIRTVYSVCDLVNASMAAATDQTITVTEYLKSLYPQHLKHKIAVVHDGIERPEVCKTRHRSDSGSRTHPLHAILVTSDPLHELPVIGAPPPWLRVTIVGRYAPSGQTWRRLREAHWRLKMRHMSGDGLAYLRFLANPRIRCVAWHPDEVYDALRQADIGIIPIDTSPGPEPGEPSPRWSVKSENRLTLKMCVGLPLIATPIPAYEPVIDHGKNGFFARSHQDWFEYLEVLRDPATRRVMGHLARESVVTCYSTQEQARKLITIMRTLTSSS